MNECRIDRNSGSAFDINFILFHHSYHLNQVNISSWHIRKYYQCAVVCPSFSFSHFSKSHFHHPIQSVWIKSLVNLGKWFCSLAYANFGFWKCRNIRKSSMWLMLKSSWCHSSLIKHTIDPKHQKIVVENVIL